MNGRAQAGKFRILAAALACLVITATLAPADVVNMKDGRRFEGNVVSQTDQQCSIDTVVSTIRATITVPMSDVAKIDRSPVAADWFAMKMNPPADKSARTFPEGSNVYLEIPITGRIGEQIVPAGIARCLAYAAENRVKHVVFTVDSQGGDMDAASQIAKLLRQYDDRLTYHSVVRDAVGLATLFPIYSKTVHLLPGATMGGVAIIFDPKKQPGATEALMQARIARQAAAIAQKHGQPGMLVSPMIDPNCQITLWRDDSGLIQSGFKLPYGVPQNRLFFSNVDKPQLLTLNRDDAIAAKFGTAFDGSVQDLGAALNLSGWTQESDYGYKTLQQSSQTAYDQRLQANADYEKNVATVTQRREELVGFVKQNVDDANQWDPSKLLPLTWGFGSGGNDSRVVTIGGGQTNTFTDKADMAVAALARAINGVDELINLEGQAARLGLPAMFKPGQLESQKTSMRTRAGYLQRERDRQSNVVSY